MRSFGRLRPALAAAILLAAGEVALVAAPAAAATCDDLLIGRSYACNTTLGEVFLRFSDQDAGASFTALVFEPDGSTFTAPCTCEGKGPASRARLRSQPDFQCAGTNVEGAVIVYSGKAIGNGQRISRGQRIDFGDTTVESTGASVFECSEP